MKIKDLGRTVTGKTPNTKKPEYFVGNIPFITPTDIAQGFVINDTERHLSEEGFLSIKSNTLNDISVLVGCIGSDMGNVGISTQKCATNQQINAITDFSEEINPYYIYYYLSLRKSYLRQIAGMTTTPILPKSTFDEIDIPIPSKIRQDKVAEVLLSIDHKIKLNQKICAELESMTKTLYDYWFMQFDFPDENGRPYRTSGGEMVWNDQLKRDIPKGWGIGKIKQLGSIISGGTPSTKHEEYYCDYGFAWITPNDLSGNEGKMFIGHGERDVTQDGIDNSSATLMPKGSVLLSTRAPIGYLAIAENKLSTNQGFKSIVPDAGYSEYYIYYLLLRNILALEKQGVGTTFKEISKDTLAEFEVLLPSKNIANKFAESIQSACELRAKLEKENRELTRLRDWLLPMLMNGQATVE